MNNIVDWIDGWNVGGKTSIIWFVLLAAILVFIALKIVKQAEVLTAKTKFGGGLVGGVLIAVISAAPEFITSIQQSIMGDPGAGSADNTGANAISALLIGFAALLFIRETFLNRLNKWTIATLWITFFMAGFVMLFMYLKIDVWIGSQGHFLIGLVPLTLVLVYFVLLWLTNKYDDHEEHIDNDDYVKKTSVKRASWMFVMWGTLLIGISILLNFFATSLEHGFSIAPQSAGGLFLSITMALPEAVAFFALLKSKQWITAVSVLVGHNFAIFFSEWLVDAAYNDSPSFVTEQVHEVWPIALINFASFGFLALSASLHKVKIFKENKIVYSILPTMAVLTFVVGWIMILTMYY